MAWWSKALDIISAPLSQPKTFLTKGISAAAKEVKATRESISQGKTSPLKVIGTTLASTAVVATGVLAVAGAGAGGVAGGIARTAVTKTLPKAVKSVAKAVVPKTLTGKITATTATIIGAGVLKSSEKARSSVSKKITSLPSVPAKMFSIGEDIGGVIEGEKTLGGSDLIKGAKTAGIVGAVAVGSAIVIPKIYDAVTKEKAPKEEKPLVSPVEKQTIVAPEEQIIKEKPVGVPTAPEQPKTTSIKSAPRKRYKRRRTKKTPQVRNNVRVNVINAPKVTGLSMKRYIKQELLA